MKKLNKREHLLLVLTIAVAVGALAYIYVLEPLLKTSIVSDSVSGRYQQYIRLLDNKENIRKRAEEIFTSDYWKKSPEEQQSNMHIQIEKIARDSGIREVRSIYPLSMQKKNDYDEIALQMDLECSVYALTKLLYNIANSNVPLQVRKLQIFGETGNPKLIKTHIEISSIWIPNPESK